MINANGDEKRSPPSDGIYLSTVGKVNYLRRVVTRLSCLDTFHNREFVDYRLVYRNLYSVQFALKTLCDFPVVVPPKRGNLKKT